VIDFGLTNNFFLNYLLNYAINVDWPLDLYHSFDYPLNFDYLGHFYYYLFLDRNIPIDYLFSFHKNRDFNFFDFFNKNNFFNFYNLFPDNIYFYLNGHFFDYFDDLLLFDDDFFDDFDWYFLLYFLNDLSDHYLWNLFDDLLDDFNVYWHKGLSDHLN
jgi:hypothetical protein